MSGTNVTRVARLLDLLFDHAKDKRKRRAASSRVAFTVVVGLKNAWREISGEGGRAQAQHASTRIDYGSVCTAQNDATVPTVVAMNVKRASSRDDYRYDFASITFYGFLRTSRLRACRSAL